MGFPHRLRRRHHPVASLRATVTVAVFLSCLALLGCSVVMAARQPEKRDLTVLEAGTPRELVLAQLGTPQLTEIEGGRRVDYFQFKQGYAKSTRVGRAVFHAAADVVTIGLWEVIGTPTEAAFDGTPVSLKVVYDSDVEVSGVTVIKGKSVAGHMQLAERKRETGGQLLASAPPLAGPVAASAPPSQYAPGYDYKVAVVIGINEYEHWSSLEGARTDADRVARQLQRKGFDVIEVYDDDATRERILEILGEELQEKSTSESLALVFFAGHGQTETLPSGEKRGYIIPVDGDPERVFSTSISMETIRDLSHRLPAKHVFYAMDSCYSGLGFVRGVTPAPNTESYLAKVTSRRAVQMITAGREGEVAIEIGGRGIFTTHLLRALDGEADFNGDGYVTASEIGAYLPSQVTAATRSRQTPMFGTLEGTGEVVFAAGSLRFGGESP